MAGIERIMVEDKIPPRIIYEMVKRGVLDMAKWDEAIAAALEMERMASDMESEWKDGLPGTYERINQFISDGVVTEERVVMMRQNYLLQRYEELMRRKYETGEEDPSIKRVAGEYVSRKTQDRLSDLEIASAREYPMDGLVETRRGKAVCPFHNEKTPSFTVKKNMYYCFGCQRGGDTIRFVMESRGMNFYDAVKYINTL